MTSFRSYLPHSYQSCRLPGSSLSPDSKWTYLLLFLLLLSSVLTFSTVFLADLSSSISTVITALICPLYDPIGPTFLLVLSSQFCLPSDILAFLPTFSTFRRVLPCSQVLLQPDDLLFLLSPRSYLLPDLSVSTFFMVPDGLPPTWPTFFHSNCSHDPTSPLLPSSFDPIFSMVLSIVPSISSFLTALPPMWPTFFHSYLLHGPLFFRFLPPTCPPCFSSYLLPGLLFLVLPPTWSTLFCSSPSDLHPLLSSSVLTFRVLSILPSWPPFPPVLPSLWSYLFYPLLAHYLLLQLLSSLLPWHLLIPSAWNTGSPFFTSNYSFVMTSWRPLLSSIHSRTFAPS